MDFQFELNFDDVFEGHIKNEDTTFAEETLNISNEEIKIKEPPLSLYDFRKDENEEDKSSLDLKPDVDIALKPEENHDTSLGMQDSSINEQICQSVNDVANPFLSADKNNEVVIKKEPIEDEFIDNKEPPLLENIKEEVHWEEATETLYSIPPAEKPIIESGKPQMAICMSVGNSTSKEIQKFTTPQNQKSFNLSRNSSKQSMETQAGSAKVVKKKRYRLKNNNKGPNILEEVVSNRSMRTRSRSNKTTDIPLAAYCRMINKSINQTMDVDQYDAGVEKHPSPISKDKTILNPTKTVKHTKNQSTTSTADLNISKSTTKSTQKQPETNQTISSENQLNNTRNTSTRLTRSRLKSNKSLSLSSFCNQLSATLNLTGNIENVFNVTAMSESQTNNTIDKSNKTFPVNTNSKSKSNQQNNKAVTLPQSNEPSSRKISNNEELQKAYDISGQTDNLETTQNVSTNKRTSTSTLNKYTEESFTTSPVVVKQKTGKDVTRTKKSFEEISMQVENESPSKEKNVSANEPRSATPKKNLTDTSINTKRKGRVCFTKKEEENLLEGVKKYGFGCWAKILKNYHFNPCRANVSLKDKYRTLQNQGKV
ncbi:uncharacterized protein DDB_G0275275-like [Clytia hemisphaerica]|uniref:Myb-like domain-containing protein n=1 Tax=Clytia hemisphaerica TaxID=252671 RepID=A0A7M6DQE5_9CNID